MNILRKIILTFTIFAAVSLAGCSKDVFDAEKIEFAGQEIETQRKATVEVRDNQVNIVAGGKYLFTGGGQNIQVKVDTLETVEIYFDNLTINNENLTFLNIKSKGTVNIISIGDTLNKIVVYGEEKKECIEAKGRVLISGDTLLSMYGHHCINADYIDISANIELKSNGDTLKAETINIHGGKAIIYSDSDCMDADEIDISDCELILSGEDKDSRGIYADKKVNIISGSISIDTKNDGIASKESIQITAGDINISSGDDAMHADEEIQIDGGNIKIEKCLEGIESAVIYINGGNIDIKSGNDGLNAAQSDKDNGKSADIYINGGTVKIDAECDGLDANGSIYVNGGVIFISGSADDENNAIDFDADFVIKGGIIVAAGNSEKAKLPYDKGAQNTAFIKYDDMQPAGENIIIYDEDYNVLLLADFPKAYNCIVFSSSLLAADKIYYIGKTKNRNIKNDYIIQPDANLSDIEKLGEFKITNTISWAEITG